MQVHKSQLNKILIKYVLYAVKNKYHGGSFHRDIVVDTTSTCNVCYLVLKGNQFYNSCNSMQTWFCDIHILLKPTDNKVESQFQYDAQICYVYSHVDCLLS